MQLLIATYCKWTIHYNQLQQSMNDCWCCMYDNWKVVCLPLCITDVLAVFIGTQGRDMATAHSENEYQRSVRDFRLFKSCNLSGGWLQTSRNEVLFAFREKQIGDTLCAPSGKWSSMECHWFSILHLRESNCKLVASIHKWGISRV